MCAKEEDVKKDVKKETTTAVSHPSIVAITLTTKQWVVAMIFFYLQGQ